VGHWAFPADQRGNRESFGQVSSRGAPKRRADGSLIIFVPRNWWGSSTFRPGRPVNYDLIGLAAAEFRDEMIKAAEPFHLI
jgi:hypothetical protein